MSAKHHKLSYTHTSVTSVQGRLMTAMLVTRDGGWSIPALHDITQDPNLPPMSLQAVRNIVGVMWRRGYVDDVSDAYVLACKVSEYSGTRGGLRYKIKYHKRRMSQPSGVRRRFPRIARAPTQAHSPAQGHRPAQVYRPALDIHDIPPARRFKTLKSYHSGTMSANIMKTLYWAKKPLTGQEIQKLLGANIHTSSSVLSTLKAKGLITATSEKRGVSSKYFLREGLIVDIEYNFVYILDSLDRLVDPAPSASIPITLPVAQPKEAAVYHPGVFVRLWQWFWGA